MRAFVLLALFVMRGLAAAQGGTTFNVVHQNVVEGPAVGYSVKEISGGYLVFSDQRGWSPSPQDPFTSLFSIDGVLLSERDFIRARYCNFGWPDPVTRVTSGGFAAAVTVFGWTSALDSIFLYRFGDDGDTLFSRFLGTDTTFGVRKCIQGANGDLLFTGLHEPPKEQFCLRTDTLGNILSSFAFPGFDGSGIAEDVNGDIYLSGQWIYPNPRGSLIKCNPAGAVHWFQLQPLGPATTGLYRTVKVLADGSVFVCGYFVQYVNPFPEIMYAHAVRYSSTGEIIWQDTARSTSNGYVIAELNDAFQRSDGSIVAAGSYSTQQIGGHGFVRTYALNGSVLWDRQFTYYDTVEATGTHRIWDVEPTSDGGMVLTGEAWNNTQQSPPNLWLVKLDSMGCLVPGCNLVGMEEMVTDLQSHLVVSPNPASDLVNVLLELPEGGEAQGQTQVQLLDASGRMVLEEKVQQNLNKLSVTLNVSALPGGIYYLHLHDARRWLAGSKVVVRH